MPASAPETGSLWPNGKVADSGSTHLSAPPSPPMGARGSHQPAPPVWAGAPSGRFRLDRQMVVVVVVCPGVYRLRIAANSIKSLRQTLRPSVAPLVLPCAPIPTSRTPGTHTCTGQGHPLGTSRCLSHVWYNLCFLMPGEKGEPKLDNRGWDKTGTLRRLSHVRYNLCSQDMNLGFLVAWLDA